MIAAEREGPEKPAPPGAIGTENVRPSDMDDSPEFLASAYPLHEPLAMSQRLLGPTHSRAENEAARLAGRARSLALWSSWAGVAALSLLALQTLLPALLATPSPGLTKAVRIAEGAAAAVALVGFAWIAAASDSKKALLERHRAERCRLLKFRFLIDPNLWTRRGTEAAERRTRFETEASECQGLTPGGLEDWASKDTVAFAPTLPVGSGIDHHTVHTLVDYYQERRLNPQLEEVEGAIGRAASRDVLSRASAGLFLAAVVLVAIHLFLESRFSGATGLSSAARGIWSAVAAAVAVILPAIGVALRLSRGGLGSGADRTRLAGMHHALSEISARLQKASGAEAIFRELGFCEDVLESHQREWLRARLAD